MSNKILIQCQGCGEVVHPDEYNDSSNECNECHDAQDLALDECGCERCVDRALSRAESYGDE